MIFPHENGFTLLRHFKRIFFLFFYLHEWLCYELCYHVRTIEKKNIFLSFTCHLSSISKRQYARFNVNDFIIRTNKKKKFKNLANLVRKFWSNYRIWFKSIWIKKQIIDGLNFINNVVVDNFNALEMQF